MLHNMVFFGKFEGVASGVTGLAELTDEEVEDFLRSLVLSTDEDDPYPNLIGDSLAGLKLQV